MALCLALSCLRYSNAQDVTGNLIYSTVNPPPSGSVYSWSGFTLTESGGGGLSGGDMPAYNSTLGQFMFGYTPGTISYSMAVSSALSGTGIQVTGIQYGLQYFNQDYSRGSLSTTVTLYDNTNKILQSYYHSLGATTEGWTNFDMTKTFTNPYSLSSVGNLSLTLTGQDDRFWAGYYGPQVRNPYARLTYGADQCSTNPLSSPTCSGFSAALSSRTAVPTATEPVAATAPATSTTTTAAAATPTVTATVTATASAAPTNTTAAPAQRSTAAAPRLENIIRAVNESTAATVTATVNTSQEQARAQEQAAAQQAESQSQQSQQMTATSPTAAARVSATSETGTDAAAGSFTRPGDPAAAARGVAPVVITEPPQESRPQPRTIQPPAELAGGPSVVAFQTSVDITAYTNIALRDAQFYAPREIYRGQQTVDNARALRGLGTDRLHQDMVDQQYRR